MTYAATTLLLSALAGSAAPVVVEPADRPVPIVGGEPVVSGEWPDAAGIIYRGGVVACGGTLIAPDLVLTAAHCLTGDPVAVALDTVALDRPGEIIGVLGGWRAPAGYDAAVLVLEREATVRPRQIARGCALEPLVAGAPAIAAGYGAIDEGGITTSAELRQVALEIRAPTCTDPDAGCHTDLPPDAELIAGGGGSDSCRGDSGGPLYLPTAHGDYLIGVTSRGTADEDTLCGGGGIYVRADRLAAQIEVAFGRSLPVPTCGPAAIEVSELRERYDAEAEAEGCSASGRSPALLWLALGVLVFSSTRRGRQHPG